MATSRPRTPKQGPAIVITNHKANLDPVIVGMICERPLRYMAKKELFKNPVLRKV
ncbi:MAG: 1-acyl-sn-glycerol-3-phosphate acyltransferase, partial [Chloroflexota bacterium]